MRKIPEEMERMILEMLQQGEMYKAIVDRTGVSETTVGRVARENGICRIKRNHEKVKDNYPQELLDEWDRVRIKILEEGYESNY
mgnify:CR=1 FL=1